MTETTQRFDMRKSARITVAAAGAVLSLALSATPAWGWGGTGHELVSGAAIDALPADLPAFLHTKEAHDQIALLGREPDRWRGSGRTHDSERDPAHYVNIADDEKIAGVSVGALPETRAEFDAAIRAAGARYPGYLPYAIVDGWQQLVKDFAIWRVSSIGAVKAASPADRAWFAADVRLREALIVRDLGVWSHYVGDASQPMHVTDHHDGWDAYPDPMTYPPPGAPPEVKGVHAFFEGTFVHRHVTSKAVAAAMAPYGDCACTVRVRTARYLATSFAQVRPLYELVKSGAFRDGTPAAQAFATARVAAGASELRDMVIDAWKASEGATIGYPAVTVADVAAGKIPMTPAIYGAD